MFLPIYPIHLIFRRSSTYPCFVCLIEVDSASMEMTTCWWLVTLTESHCQTCKVAKLTRICVSVRPNHSGFTARLCRQGQRYPGAVWTTELRLEPVATVSSGHGPRAGRPAMPDLGRGALSRRSGPGAWQLPARPSYRRRQQARQSQGWHSPD